MDTVPASLPPSMVPAMALALEASFGSVAQWREGFRMLCAAALAHGGAVQLSFVPPLGRMAQGAEGDAAGAAGAATPLLRFEPPTLGPLADAHAHVDAFVQAIDWADVYTRYQHAVEAASEGLDATHDDLPGVRVLDVRRAGVFAKAEHMIPGATWRDPGQVGTWASTLPADEPVVVYCIYGHEVGRATALRLQAAGVRARFLRGGIDGWQAAGRPVQARETQP